MEENLDERDEKLEYLRQVYGENTLKTMIEEWKKEILDEKLEDWLKKKIEKQYAFLKNLRENETTIK